MTSKNYDYGEFADDEDIGGNLMARIEGLATDFIAAETRVANLEAQLVEAKASVRLIEEKSLPDLLDEAQLSDSKISTPSGLEVSMSEVIRGSIPKGNEEPAFAWLEKYKHGALIKRKFVIEFGKDQEKWANKFQRDCAQRKRSLNLKRSKSVNPQSLCAFVRGQLKEGIDIPMKTFGVFRQRFAKVKVKTKS